MIKEIQKKIADYYGTDKWIDDTINDVANYPSNISYVSDEEMQDYIKESQVAVQQLTEFKQTDVYKNYKVEQLLFIQNLFSGLSNIKIDVDTQFLLSNENFPTLSNIKNMLFKPENFRNIMNNEALTQLLNNKFTSNMQHRELMLILFPEIKKIHYSVSDIMKKIEVRGKKFSSFENAYEEFHNYLINITRQLSPQYYEIIEEMAANRVVDLQYHYAQKKSWLTTPMAEIIAKDFFDEDLIVTFVKMTDIQKQKYIDSLSLDEYKEMSYNFLNQVVIYQTKLEVLEDAKDKAGLINDYENIKNTLYPIERSSYIEFIKIWAKKVLSEDNFLNENIRIVLNNIFANDLPNADVQDIICECLFELKEKDREELVYSLYAKESFDSKRVPYFVFKQYCADRNFEKKEKKNENVFNLMEPENKRVFSLNISDVEDLLADDHKEIFRFITSKHIDIATKDNKKFSIVIEYNGINDVSSEKISQWFSDLIKEVRTYVKNKDVKVYREFFSNNEEIVSTKLRELVLNHMLDNSKENDTPVRKRKKV